LRSTVLDLVHIFEVNRKETARVLLTLPRYFASNTFKPSAGTEVKDEPTETVSTLSLESLVVSTVLNAMTLLPTSPCKEVYYTSVIAELCKLSPNTVAPPVGRSVRKLYTMLGTDGLDVEVIRRIAEWFAVHLSNFGFQWMWKEWSVAANLSQSEPTDDQAA
jgi:nuclear cap-binding protein subunit 1